MKRIESEELLDEEGVPPADMERSLRDLRWFNKYCGGVNVYRWLVREVAPRSIVDLGTGTSDLLESVAHVPLRVGVDFRIDHLLYLRDRAPRVHRVVADARRLPFRDGAADLVTSSHFFHHFSPDENVGILNESLRLARNVAVTDTRRHILPFLFVWLLGALRLVGRVTAFDAPASVRQGYTVGEARLVATRVSAARKRVVRKWPFRWAMLLSR